MNKIYFDTRWIGKHGIGRFAFELFNHLPQVEEIRIPCRKLSPLDPVLTSIALHKIKSGVYFSPGFNPPLHCKIPFAFTIHDLAHIKFPASSSALKRFYYNNIVAPASKKAKTIFTVSEFSRQEILSYFNLDESKVVVAGNSVSKSFSERGNKHKGRRDYFLHVGRRGENKNIQRLISAFSSSGAFKDVDLILTGDKDMPTIKIINDNSITAKARESIYFTGIISDDTLAEYYRGAVATIFPSLYEGFGIPVIESMACGTPVIASRIPAIIETAGHGNAAFIDPLDTESISQAIVDIMNSDLLRDSFRKLGLNRSADFSWDKVSTIVDHALNNN